MAQFYRRIPRGYDGTERTCRQVTDLLPAVLARVERSHEGAGRIVVAAWKEIAGERIAPMTEAVSFEHSVLKVRVKNATLYALLTQYEKPKLLEKLRRRFPKIEIRDIVFRR